MSWENWLTDKKFTLFRSSIIQEQFIECILDHSKIGNKILETGFGFGITIELLRDIGYDVYGFDLEKTAIDDAEKRYPLLKNKLWVGDILREDSYEQKFDVIIYQGVLEHFSDDEIIKILQIQMKFTDKIIFDVPNSFRQNVEDKGDKTRFEHPEFWEKIIDMAGFSFKRFGRNYDFGDDLLPKKLKRYDSDLMKKVGRSSIFVVEKKDV